MLLGTAIVLLVERPPQPQIDRGVTANDLSLQHSQLPQHR